MIPKAKPEGTCKTRAWEHRRTTVSNLFTFAALFGWCPLSFDDSLFVARCVDARRRARRPFGPLAAEYRGGLATSAGTHAGQLDHWDQGVVRLSQSSSHSYGSQLTCLCRAGQLVVLVEDRRASTPLQMPGWFISNLFAHNLKNIQKSL
uniref:Uncharacterized protein n=1 Tax=Romanomermis culicivorax TaxID=13658 RepID=A0A915JAX1_ROMCU